MKKLMRQSIPRPSAQEPRTSIDASVLTRALSMSHTLTTMEVFRRFLFRGALTRKVRDELRLLKLTVLQKSATANEHAGHGAEAFVVDMMHDVLETRRRILAIAPGNVDAHALTGFLISRYDRILQKWLASASIVHTLPEPNDGEKTLTGAPTMMEERGEKGRIVQEDTPLVVEAAVPEVERIEDVDRPTFTSLILAHREKHSRMRHEDLQCLIEPMVKRARTLRIHELSKEDRKLVAATLNELVTSVEAFARYAFQVPVMSTREEAEDVCVQYDAWLAHAMQSLPPGLPSDVRQELIDVFTYGGRPRFIERVRAEAAHNASCIAARTETKSEEPNVMTPILSPTTVEAPDLIARVQIVHAIPVWEVVERAPDVPSPIHLTRSNWDRVIDVVIPAIDAHVRDGANEAHAPISGTYIAAYEACAAALRTLREEIPEGGTERLAELRRFYVRLWEVLQPLDGEIAMMTVEVQSAAIASIMIFLRELDRVVRSPGHTPCVTYETTLEPDERSADAVIHLLTYADAIGFAMDRVRRERAIVIEDENALRTIQRSIVDDASLRIPPEGIRDIDTLTGVVAAIRENADRSIDAASAGREDLGALVRASIAIEHQDLTWPLRTTSRNITTAPPSTLLRSLHEWEDEGRQGVSSILIAMRASTADTLTIIRAHDNYAARVRDAVYELARACPEDTPLTRGDEEDLLREAVAIDLSALERDLDACAITRSGMDRKNILLACATVVRRAKNILETHEIVASYRDAIIDTIRARRTGDPHMNLAFAREARTHFDAFERDVDAQYAAIPGRLIVRGDESHRIATLGAKQFLASIDTLTKRLTEAGLCTVDELRAAARVYATGIRPSAAVERAPQGTTPGVLVPSTSTEPVPLEDRIHHVADALREKPLSRKVPSLNSPQALLLLRDALTEQEMAATDPMRIPLTTSSATLYETLTMDIDMWLEHSLSRLKHGSERFTTIASITKTVLDQFSDLKRDQDIFVPARAAGPASVRFAVWRFETLIADVVNRLDASDARQAAASLNRWAAHRVREAYALVAMTTDDRTMPVESMEGIASEEQSTDEGQADASIDERQQNSFGDALAEIPGALNREAYLRRVVVGMTHLATRDLPPVSSGSCSREQLMQLEKLVDRFRRNITRAAVKALRDDVRFDTAVSMLVAHVSTISFDVSEFRAWAPIDIRQQWSMIQRTVRDLLIACSTPQDLAATIASTPEKPVALEDLRAALLPQYASRDPELRVFPKTEQERVKLDAYIASGRKDARIAELMNDRFCGGLSYWSEACVCAYRAEKPAAVIDAPDDVTRTDAELPDCVEPQMLPDDTRGGVTVEIPSLEVAEAELPEQVSAELARLREEGVALRDQLSRSELERDALSERVKQADERGARLHARLSENVERVAQSEETCTRLQGDIDALLAIADEEIEAHRGHAQRLATELNGNGAGRDHRTNNLVREKLRAQIFTLRETAVSLRARIPDILARTSEIDTIQVGLEASFSQLESLLASADRRGGDGRILGRRVPAIFQDVASEIGRLDARIEEMHAIGTDIGRTLDAIEEELRPAMTFVRRASDQLIPGISTAIFFEESEWAELRLGLIEEDARARASIESAREAVRDRLDDPFCSLHSSTRERLTSYRVKLRRERS